MPSCCSDLRCTNKYENGYCLVNFPKDEATRQLWIKAIGRLGWQPKPSDRLCDVHFKPSDWIELRKLLKPKVVPSIFCDGCGRVPFPSAHLGSPVSPVTGRKLYKKSVVMEHRATCPIALSEDVRRCATTSKQEIIGELRMEVGHLNDTVHVLKRKVNTAVKELEDSEKTVDVLKEVNRNRAQWWNNKFTPEQIKAAQTGNSRGREWSIAAVQKALDIKLSAGSSGLATVNQVLFPGPCNRTIQRKIKDIKFQPGLLHEFLDPLKEKVNSFSLEEKDCAIYFDEMAIKAQVCYDMGICDFVGKVTLPGANGLAKKIEHFMLGGIRSRWKLSAAYHGTLGHGCAPQRAQVLRDILKFAADSGLNVLALVCDMGNRDVLSQLGFDTTKAVMKYSIPNPFQPEKTLRLVPDVVHVFKSIKEMLVNNKEAVLHKDVVTKYNLPSPLVCVAHIEALVKYQEDMEFKFAPRLTVKDLYPSHFGKMNTNGACHVFSHHGAGALDFLADQNVFDAKVKTTAWFMDLMNKWFKILSSRSLVNALSLKNMTAYEEAISVMRLVIEVFKTMKVGAHWKPCQTHAIMATESLLEIAHHLLFEKGYDYVRMGLFANDIVENSFSDVRRQRPVPNFLEAKYRLRQCTLSQCSRKVLKSQYAHDDRVNLLTLQEVLDSIKMKKQNEPPPPPPQLLPCSQPPPVSDGYKFRGQILYRMCGYLLHSMRNECNQLKCDECFQRLQLSAGTVHPLQTWTENQDFIPGAQIKVSTELFNLLHAIDFNISTWEPQLLKINQVKSSVLLSVQPLVEKLNVVLCESCTPSLQKLIISRFIDMRLKILTKRLSEAKNNEETGTDYNHLSSKSMGCRKLADNYHVGMRM